MQINNMAALVKVVAVSLPQNNTAPSGQHTASILRQLIDHILLEVTKNLFSFALEKFANRAAYAPLYHQVRIEKSTV